MKPDEHERLHVLLGYACNNNCIFCMEEDRGTRAQRILEVPPETVRALLERGSGGREVMFTSGEPLLNRHFLRYVRWARELGFATIGVITNGRLFAYDRFARKTLTAGLNHIVVSVHGAGATSHDRLTRTAASYAQTVLGLRVLARLKRGFDFRLHTATVVNRRNYRELHEIWESLRGLRVDQFVFNVIQPVGRAEVHFERLVPRFSDIAAEFRAFLGQAGDPQPPVFLLDIPYCVTEDLPDAVRGFVERYQYYEHEDGLDDALPIGEDRDGVAVHQPGEGPGDDGPRLHRLTRRKLDETRKTHREACRRCVHEADCDGVWNRYLDAYGWDEFQPVLRREERERR